MSAPGRNLQTDREGAITATLTGRDCQLLAALHRDVVPEWTRLNASPLTPELRELLRFIEEGATWQRRLRTPAHPDALVANGMRSSAPASDQPSATLDLMTAGQVVAFAAARGVSVSRAHVRKVLEAVDRVGPTKLYRAGDARDYVEQRREASS